MLFFLCSKVVDFFFTWSNMIKKISALYFFWLVCSWFPRTTVHKNLCFSWWHCLITHCDNWVANSITARNQVHWSGMKTVSFMPSHLHWINFYFLFRNQIINILFRFVTLILKSLLDNCTLSTICGQNVHLRCLHCCQTLKITISFPCE